MSTQTDYYSILEVDNNATQDDIKKKYRKLSMKHHPDKNGNSKESEEIFKGISEAYNTIGDPSKRRDYDMNLKFSNISSSSSPSDLFSMFFNVSTPTSQSKTTNMTKMGAGMPSLFSMFNMGHNMNSTDVPIKMNVFDNILAEQIEKEFNNLFISGSINRNNHREKPTRVSTVEPASDKMLKPPTIHTTITIDLMQAFTGCSLPIEVDRELWHDSTIREREKETIYVSIPAGIDDNEVIVLKEKGHVNHYNITGDVKINVRVENKSEFVRSGIDLHLHKHITLKEALCGFSFEIKHLTGKQFRINNKMGNIIQPEFKKQIEKMGMVRDNHVGNLIVCFHVKFPDVLPVETLQKFAELL